MCSPHQRVISLLGSCWTFDSAVSHRIRIYLFPITPSLSAIMFGIRCNNREYQTLPIDSRIGENSPNGRHLKVSGYPCEYRAPSPHWRDKRISTFHPILCPIYISWNISRKMFPLQDANMRKSSLLAGSWIRKDIPIEEYLFRIKENVLN